MGYDKLSIERADLLHPALRAEAKLIYHEANNKLGKSRLRFAQTGRTFEEQEELYSYGRYGKHKNKRKVTNAKPGESYHNYALALDIVLLIDKDGNGTYESASWDTIADWDNDGIADWLEVVKVFQKYGWTWGFWSNGKHWDKPHFQKTFGKNISQLKSLHKAGKVDCEGYVLI